jgi:protein-tyrosine-phosphatase
MAEYIVRKRLGDRTQWSVSSAGVYAADGNPASAEAVNALREWDIDLTPHRSRMLRKEHVDAATLIVVMTDSHRAEILRAHPEARERVHLLTSFGPAGAATNVFDPIGGSLNVYRSVRDQINSATSDMILYMMDHWGL